MAFQKKNYPTATTNNSTTDYDRSYSIGDIINHCTQLLEMKSSRATISPRKEQGNIAEEKDIKPCTTTSTNLSVEDDFNGISIMSLANSLAEHKPMPQSIERHRPTLVQRKLYVSPSDPRPGVCMLLISGCFWFPFPTFTSISDMIYCY